MATGRLLVAKGRVLTPRSRFRYRVERMALPRREGFESVDEHTIVGLVVRVVTLPLLTLADVVSWPVVRPLLGRRSWWVVEVRFHGVDAELVRIAEAATYEEAITERAELTQARRRAEAGPAGVPAS